MVVFLRPPLHTRLIITAVDTIAILNITVITVIAGILVAIILIIIPFAILKSTGLYNFDS